MQILAMQKIDANKRNRSQEGSQAMFTEHSTPIGRSYKNKDFGKLSDLKMLRSFQLLGQLTGRLLRANVNLHNASQ